MDIVFRWITNLCRVFFIRGTENRENVNNITYINLIKIRTSHLYSIHVNSTLRNLVIPRYKYNYIYNYAALPRQSPFSPLGPRSPIGPGCPGKPKHQNIIYNNRSSYMLCITEGVFKVQEINEIISHMFTPAKHGCSEWRIV